MRPKIKRTGGDITVSKMATHDIGPNTGGPQVSIVIVSWNVADLVEGCLGSIVKHSSDIPIQVIVVDNASKDDTVQRLRKNYPWVQVIANKANIGFARANNQALKHVNGAFVFLLNPDTTLGEGTLNAMMGLLQSHPDVGMVGPRIMFPNGHVQDMSARLLPTLAWSLLCECFHLNKLPMIGPWITRRYVSPYNYNLTQQVEAISGAAMMIRRSVIEQIGLFGESFIHCGEDVDLCFRIQKSGWNIIYLCDAGVIHYDGKSRAQAPVRIEINTNLSIQQYFVRCFGKVQGVCYRMIVQVIKVPITLMVGIVKMLTGGENLEGLKRRCAIAKGIWCWRPVK
jgi:GT2 family glycosyltransferase